VSRPKKAASRSKKAATRPKQKAVSRTKKKESSSKKPTSRKGPGRAGARAKLSAAEQPKPLRPVKLTGKKIGFENSDERGPLGWLLPVMEATYSQLGPAGPAAPLAGALMASSLQASGTPAVLAPVSRTVWRDILQEYKRRKSQAVRAAVTAAAAAVPAPFVPGGVNWSPLGPIVVLNGQTVGNQPVGGRVPGLAIAPGGQVVYAGSANGGVFRSEDGGTTWKALMDRFDLSPTNFASASLVCGAIALDPADPQRVYVGTGEGDTNQIFQAHAEVVNALPAYRGVGPLRSDDGGANWVPEASTPDLAGEAFFALAVDPRNRENVVGATSAGLYQRVPQGTDFVWQRRRANVHPSVVAASDGTTARFFAAEWGQGVFQSDDGSTWTTAGRGFPTNDVGRITLAAQASNPNLLYAFVARASTGGVHGVYRLDSPAGDWQPVANLPDVLPLNQGRSQGDYDLAIAVDPVSPDRFYLGGSYANISPFPGSVWRCDVRRVGAGYRVTSSASIGSSAHADVHVLVHTPGDPTELWCGCDGGVFLNRDPGGSGAFASQNTGLGCLCCNFIAQHPTDPNVLFTGLQDNGTARTDAGPVWSHVQDGDGGYCVINWRDPDLVLVYANGSVYRSTSGGKTHDSWSTQWKFDWATMTQPIVGTPYNPSSPNDADLVAVGAGLMVFMSNDFAASWPANLSFSFPGGSGSVFTIAFASTTRLFVGTTTGQVFRVDRAGGSWSLTRLDRAAAGPLGLTGLISEIAVDWADASLASVYVAFGGMGDRRRVWRFDGSKWEARCGPAGGDCLLNVEHNTLVVDRSAPGNLYVGADIGVWHSPDAGMSWNPLSNGLPGAPVFDLQFHPTQRLLRAATYGRGVFELPLA
jgi:hypothetical protein